MEELKTKRTVSKQQFTRTLGTLRKLLGNGLAPETTIQRKFGELSAKWQTVQDAHDMYMTKVKEEEIEEESQWIEELLEKFEKIEIDSDAALLKFKDVRQTSPMVEQSRQSGPSNVQGQHLQLERLKLEKFNGELRKYPSFKEKFKIYIEPIYQRSQLPFVLRSHLEPNIRDEVENVEDDMGCLWARLDLKYANHTKFVDIVLSDLEKTSKGDAKAALQLINTVEKAYNDLKRIGAAQEMANATVIAMIKKRFPDEMRLDWVKKISSRGEEDSGKMFKMMLEFLTQWRQMLECDDQVIKKLEKRSGITNLVGSNTGIGSGSRMSETCWLHEEESNHPIWKCNTFRSFPLKDKLALVKDKGACHACLEKNCKGSLNAENCRRHFRCNVDGCMKPHNSLLHE